MAPDDPKIREEYDFRGGERGKYAERHAAGTNVVVIEPELAKLFPDSKSVNDALRQLAAVAERVETSKKAG